MVGAIFQDCGRSAQHSIENIFFPIELLINVNDNRGSWDSVVGIATGYWLDDQGVGVRVPKGTRIFSSLSLPDRSWGPPSLLSNRYRGLFPSRVKRPGLEVDYTPRTSAEVKKTWTCTFTPLYVFMAWCLDRDNFKGNNVISIRSR
jgi:hypothetical protein